MESFGACAALGNGSLPAGKHRVRKRVVICRSAVKEGGRNFLFAFLEVCKSDYCGSGEKMGIKTVL